MPCRYVIVKPKEKSQIVSTSDQNSQYLCSLKLDSENQRSIIHQILVKKEMELYMTDNCPFTDTVNQIKCPYYME